MAFSVGPTLEKFTLVLGTVGESYHAVAAEDVVEEVALVGEVFCCEFVDGGLGDLDDDGLGLVEGLWGGVGDIRHLH